jgi:hypothetical protein
LDVEAFVDPEVVAACVMAGLPPIPTSMTSAATVFVDADVVAACLSPGVRELPPMRGVRYFGFVDLSGGSSNYRLHLSPNIPAKDFWSIILYDDHAVDAPDRPAVPECQ